ncbi:MAG: hypothetical protein HYY46_13905 [Deltaproteobacteria bacterium]|nr:hypothetical protein [Deltaproteobacteria bacterium]
MKKDGYELWTERLGIAICLWLCAVPFLFFVAAVLFDVRIAWASVAVAFVLILLVCNVICRFRLYEFEKEKMT